MTTSNENLIKCIEADHAGGEGMKPLVIYHADCTDGYGSAFAAWLKFGDEAEYLPMQYGQVKTVAEMNSVLSTAGIPFGEGEVYILDFSLPKDVMAWLLSNVKRVVWLDHHKSAFEMWGVASYCAVGMMWDVRPDFKHHTTLDNNKSGALLAWEYFHPGTEVPMLIRHIDDRDRWQFKLEGSKELHAALSSYKPWSFEQWRDNFWSPYSGDPHYFEEEVTKLIVDGAAILRAQEQHVQQMVKHARKCVVPGSEDKRGMVKMLTGLAVNASLHQSEVGHELANQSGTFGLIWYMDSGTRVHCSLRSNGEYDVSGIARAFGGGGHRNAAGFETDVATLMGWMK